MKISAFIAAAGTLALAGGMAGGIASTASASTPAPDGSAVVHVSGPVQGGGMWANASYTEVESLFLVSAKVVTAPVLPVAGDPTATPPILPVAAVPGETEYTYSLGVRENGRFRAIPGALTPNQGGWSNGMKIRGAVSGYLSGFATYQLVMDLKGDIKNPVVVDPAIATPQKIIDAALATPAVVSSMTYTASALVWTHVNGYWHTVYPGHWAHFKAVKGHKAHKAYSNWIPAKRVYVQDSWTRHLVTQRWIDASWNNAGQVRSAGNITGFFGHFHR